MIEAYVVNLKSETKRNSFFRRVLFTGGESQLVVMCLQPGESIGLETHDVDQILYAVDGEGEAVLNGARHRFEKGDVACVPAGVEHDFVNLGDEPLRLFTVYAPPQHRAGTVHETKADAVAAEEAVIPAGG